MKHRLTNVTKNNTVINKIKSFRWIEQSNDDVELRWGACVSSTIEVEVYGSRASAVNVGDVINYHQIVDVDNTFQPLANNTTQSIFIGVFTVATVIPNKESFSFIAYDDIYKLSKPFEWKNTYGNSVSYATIFTAMETDLGVTFDRSTIPTGLLNATTAKFYSNGFTYRDFVSQFAEACGCFVRCTSSRNIEFARYTSAASAAYPYWQAASNYFVAPTDDLTAFVGVLSPAYQNKIPVVYKQGGLTFSGKKFYGYYRASIVSQDGKSIAIAQKGEVYNSGGKYEFGSNNIINYLDSFYGNYDWGDVCDNVLNDDTVSFKQCEVHLFPFINPFRVGQSIMVADVNAEVSPADPQYMQYAAREFKALVMRMEVNDYEAIIYCDAESTNIDSSSYFGGQERKNTSIGALVGELMDKVSGELQMNTYSSTESIGMSSSDTLTDIYDALPINSILIAPASDFDTTELPSQYGVIEIVKCGQARGYIHFYGKGANHGDWRMHLDGNNEPTGTWISILDGVKTLSVGTSNSSDIKYDSNIITNLNRAYAKRTNTTCVLSFVATVAALNSSKALFTVSSNYCPSAQIDFVALASDNTAVRGEFIPTTGVIRVNNNVSAGETVRAEIVWFLE